MFSNLFKIFFKFFQNMHKNIRKIINFRHGRGGLFFQFFQVSPPYKKFLDPPLACGTLLMGEGRRGGCPVIPILEQSPKNLKFCFWMTVPSSKHRSREPKHPLVLWINIISNSIIHSIFNFTKVSLYISSSKIQGNTSDHYLNRVVFLIERSEVLSD